MLWCLIFHFGELQNYVIYQLNSVSFSALHAFLLNVQVLDKVPLMPSSSRQVVNSMATPRNKGAPQDE